MVYCHLSIHACINPSTTTACLLEVSQTSFTILPTEICAKNTQQIEIFLSWAQFMYTFCNQTLHFKVWLFLLHVQAWWKAACAAPCHDLHLVNPPSGCMVSFRVCIALFSEGSWLQYPKLTCENLMCQESEWVIH